jgi:hypothetical protein
MAVHNYGIKIKGAIGSALEVIGVLCGVCKTAGIKSYMK